MAARRRRPEHEGHDVDFDRGIFFVKEPELEQSIRAWWAKSSRLNYEWAKIEFRPPKRRGRQQARPTAAAGRSFAFTGKDVHFRRGRLIIVDPDLERRVDAWWKKSRREDYDWAKVTPSQEHPVTRRGRAAGKQITHKPGHGDSNCIGNGGC